MGLLTAGYFPAAYWVAGYWADGYWQDYGQSITGGLLTAGYFPAAYWVAGYWADGYWQDYGAGTVPATGFNCHIEAYGETCQLWGSTSGTDAFGNPEKTWNLNKGPFTGVVIRPTASDVTASAGRIADTDKKLLAPTTADIATGDRIEIDSVTYDLLGDHADWQMKLSGTTYHQQLFLRRVI